MVRRKLVAAYVLLVGLPLILLLTILRTGSHLEAPISVGGAWTVTANVPPAADTQCRELLQSIRQPFISVAQSGAQLIFNLNDRARTAIPGEISGEILTTTAGNAAAPTAAPCSDPQSIYMRAKVTKQGSGRTMTGILGFRGCDGCEPISFRAVREVRAASGAE